MSRLLAGILGVAAALAVTAGILFFTFDIEQHKAGIEEAASAATGLKVSIIGKMRLKLFPYASLALENVFMQNRGLAVVSARRSVARLELPALLRGNIRIREVVLINPKIFITKDGAGRFNFEKLETPLRRSASAAVFPDVEKIFVTQGTVLFRDEATNTKIEATACNFAVRSRLPGAAAPNGGPFFEGDFFCREAGTKDVKVSDLRAFVTAGDGKFAAKPVTMKIFGGEGVGSVQREIKGEHPEYSVVFSMTRFRFEEVLHAFRQKRNISGELNLESQLTLQGGTAEELTRTAEGVVALRGQNLLLQNIDVDRLLEKVERSQNFSLIDVGAFLIAGPLGTLLTKGYDFGSIYQEIPGAKSAIKKLVSHWKVKGGVAEAQDAAFTTPKNRFALKGKLDFVQKRFEDFSVAVLNKEGCAISSQKIHGDFKKPVIDPPRPRPSVLGPIIALLKKPFDLLQGGECKVFYRGSVAQP